MQPSSPLKRLIQGWLLCLSASFAMSNACFAADVSDYSLEQLLESEFIPAEAISQQISDSVAAVSVITDEDIRIYGYRSLGDILENMRGVFITRGSAYQYLGGRGFGVPGDYAGRIILFIDGYAVNDSVFNQIFFGEDAFLDVDIIEQVEYVPSAGSSTYGSNAFLGSINVTTKKGRDFDGFHLSADFGNEGQNRQNISFGKRFSSEAEILISLARYEDEGSKNSLSDYDIYQLFTYLPFYSSQLQPVERTKNHRLFIKGSFKDFNLKLGQVNRTLEDNTFLTWFAPEDIDLFDTTEDTSRFIDLGFDKKLSHNFTLSSDIYAGQYRYEFNTSGIIETARQDSEGRWWGGNLSVSNSSFQKHRIVAGIEYRNDDKKQFKDFIDNIDFEVIDSGFDEDAETYSVYFQDEFRANSYLTINSGIRFDDHSQMGSATSPRLALIVSPNKQTIIKASYGRAFRFRNSWETYQGLDFSRKEKSEAYEALVQHKFNPMLQLTLVHFKNKVSEAISYEFYQQETKGQELELEWIYPKWGVRSKFSASRHRPRGNYLFSEELVNSPKYLYSFSISKTFANPNVSIGLNSIYTDTRIDFDESEIPASTLVNATIRAEDILPNLSASIHVKNLLGDAAQDRIRDDLARRNDEQSLWLKLEYRFQ